MAKDAKAVKCILALWLLKDENQLSISPISIYTDSQSFVQSFKYQRARPGSYISDFFMKTAVQITKGVCPDILTHRVKLRWIAAHSNVTGNERADREAREVAKGRSSPCTSLPKLLKSQLPLNADLVKENFKARLMDNWKANWAASPHKAKMDTLDTNFPFDKFRASLRSLTCPQCLLFQLRSNHIPLNKYLNWIGKAEDKFCINCKRYRGTEVPEMVVHYLFECPSYDYERHSLDTKLGCSSRDLKAILSDKEAIRELIRFVRRTKRLKPSLGDISKFRLMADSQQDR